MDPEPRSVAALFRQRARHSPGEEAWRYRSRDGWTSLTWTDALFDVRELALGLHALGVRPGDRCAILSGTRVEWLLADLAILCAGGATTALYPSTKAGECAALLADSGAVVCFAEDTEQVEKLLAVRNLAPALRHVVLLEGDPPRDAGVLSLRDLQAQGRVLHAMRPELFAETVEAIPPDALATLIYTSGTTGTPRGVELTHAAWLAQAAALDESGFLDHADPLQLLWLPLAHSFGKMMTVLQLRLGFPTAVDGRLDRLAENLVAIRPTFVCGVPRVFEKIHAAVEHRVAAGGRFRGWLFRWATKVGARSAALGREGRPCGTLLALQRPLADALVLRRIRERFGGRLRYFVSGSAPLSPGLLEFFAAIGLEILEGYGLTETSAATHVNLPRAARHGTVGPPLPGVEVRIAEDGEVLLRAPWTMRGYHGKPEATAEALSTDGWLRTGDLGEVDDAGHLAIRGRKKELIKTSGGKFVAPAAIEARLKSLCPAVAQVLVHGEGRHYVTALVTLEPEPGRAAPDGGPEAVVQDAVDRLNAELPRHAAIRRFALLPAPFTEARGEITPSLKLRRRVIEARYRTELDALYAEPGPPAGPAPDPRSAPSLARRPVRQLG
jgi:long-chain acyl-CoA synthetase